MSQGVLKTFNVIGAACQNGGIGYKNSLPWRLKNELAYFTKMTTTVIAKQKQDTDVQSFNSDDGSNGVENGQSNNTPTGGLRNAVIMGRNSWDSIPNKYRPLPGRVNVVLSRSLSKAPEGCDYLYSSLDEAIRDLSKRSEIADLWVIGGEQIYREALKHPNCYRVYLTKIDAEFECDTFFPEIDTQTFKEVDDERVSKEIQSEKGISYRFYVYQRSA